MTGTPGSVPIRLRRNPRPSERTTTGRPPPGPETDRAQGNSQAELITSLSAAGTGDRDAFTRFYRATNARVFGLALRIARNRAVAEEITQEVYLQVWTKAHTFDPRLATPIGWLMMLTHRRAVDRVRTEATSYTRDAAYGHTHPGRDHDMVVEAVGQRLDEQAVRGCLDCLTATQREAVALAYYRGQTYREVARSLDVPLPTIKSRMRDALRRLRGCLADNVSHA
ncbi:ECF RNA polymerase sigma factor SigK [Nocardia blacklockiae]|uniref:ECF RNA polymerase sigma factor SigK n=1 Tax=Nocardia blacklockiae TaxID=480036 RepID=UPI001893F631|nr:ECF RNA polymerase sigma factor SigK [Nocardia blacklockiae]MBF6175518.1 ECF RNA polymerase sigma factor SigK [Nocardia blacklockiae]